MPIDMDTAELLALRKRCRVEPVDAICNDTGTRNERCRSRAEVAQRAGCRIDELRVVMCLSDGPEDPVAAIATPDPATYDWRTTEVPQPAAYVYLRDGGSNSGLLARTLAMRVAEALSIPFWE